MPLLSIESNCSPSADIVKIASAKVAEALGKPEQYVMVRYAHNPDMLFAGTNEPLAYLQLKSIGLPDSAATDLSAMLCDLLNEQLGIATERIYIEFKNVPRQLWGWNRATF